MRDRTCHGLSLIGFLSFSTGTSRLLASKSGGAGVDPGIGDGDHHCAGGGHGGNVEHGWK